MSGNAAPHFHIRWIAAGTSRLDWEAFASRGEADAIARRLATPFETFTIDEFDVWCERCALFRLQRKNSNREIAEI
jgi:hypothetical protein